MADERFRKWEDIDEIRDVDGVVAVITRNRMNGKTAVGIFKVFDRDGDGMVEKTAFMNPKQLDAVIRLIPIIKKRIAEIEAGDAKPRSAGIR
jgi:hypothetical protein